MPKVCGSEREKGEEPGARIQESGGHGVRRALGDGMRFGRRFGALDVFRPEDSRAVLTRPT